MAAAAAQSQQQQQPHRNKAREVAGRLYDETRRRHGARVDRETQQLWRDALADEAPSRLEKMRASAVAGGLWPNEPPTLADVQRELSRHRAPGYVPQVHGDGSETYASDQDDLDEPMPPLTPDEQERLGPQWVQCIDDVRAVAHDGSKALALILAQLERDERGSNPSRPAGGGPLLGTLRDAAGE